MKATAISLFVVISLTLTITPADSQTRRPPPRSQYSPLAAEQGENPRLQRQTWYEFALSRLNPNNVDYGAWMEDRRQAFLQATIQNRYFNYALAMTLVALFLLGAYAKLWNDSKRKEWMTAEMMTDLLNHDQHSRAAAREAIRKYNGHIERCNRVIEAADSGRPLPGSPAEVATLQAELQKKSDELTAMTAERTRLDLELAKKTLLVTELSLRVDGVLKNTNGNAETGADRGVPVSGSEHSDVTKLMRHINDLQQQLYVERTKNDRLKGA
jgi:hypothetical protein